MEIRISKQECDHVINILWNYKGSGKYSADFDDEQITRWFRIFAEEAGIDLEIHISGNTNDRKNLMKELGETFAEAICRQCDNIPNYRGVGEGIVNRQREKVSCELSLPGRVSWVYEELAEQTMKDHYATVFFESLAGCAGFRLRFHIHDDSDNCGGNMFAAFGEALAEAFTERE